MNQYCVYTGDPHFLAVAKYITEKNYKFEAHLNRTRFWVPEEQLYEFQKQWGAVCPIVPESQDLQTGQMIGEWDQWKMNKDLI
jgi:hypothetical protein